MKITYTQKVRFWLVIVPLFLSIIGFSIIAYMLVKGNRLPLRGGDFGVIAGWGLGIAIGLAFINFLTRRFLKVKKLLGKHGEILKPEHHRFLILQKKWLIDIHLATGIIGFLAMLVHAYIFWGFRNIWLIASMILFAWVILAGFLLKLGGILPKTRKYLYLIHSQWVTVVLLVLVTLLGHAGF